MSAYRFLKPIADICRLVSRAWHKFILCPLYKSRMGYCGKNVNAWITSNQKSLPRLYLYDDVFLAEGFSFVSYSGKLIMKSHSGAGGNFTVVTGNHGREVGRLIMDTERERSLEKEADVVIEEDVEIGINVTVLAGVNIGRGATVGSGAVVRSSVPPYSIVVGNPAKIVGFSFTPEQIIEHEKALYPESERLPLEKLEKNYKKYFLDRMKEIRSFTSL